MRITAGRRPHIVVLALLAACSGMSLHAQAPPPAKNPLLRLAQPWPDAEQMLQRKAQAEALRLFAAEAPIALTLKGDFRTINRDRDPNSRKRFPAELTIARENGEPHTIPVMLGARGHVRRMARTCEYSPDSDDLARGTAEGHGLRRAGRPEARRAVQKRQRVRAVPAARIPHLSGVERDHTSQLPRTAGQRELRRSGGQTDRHTARHAARRRWRCGEADGGAHRGAAACPVRQSRAAHARYDDDVRVHDRQHGFLDLCAAQRRPRADAGSHALSGAV